MYQFTPFFLYSQKLTGVLSWDTKYYGKTVELWQKMFFSDSGMKIAVCCNVIVLPVTRRSKILLKDRIERNVECFRKFACWSQCLISVAIHKLQ